jgi:hypothetical protein
MANKEYSYFDDLVLVTGLKRRDEVLFIGGNATFPWLKKHVSSVSYVKRIGDLHRMIRENRKFDRVFIARENVLDEQLVRSAALLTVTGGVICFFSEDETLRDGFATIVEQQFPKANVWPVRSNVGPLVMTDANGYPVQERG